MYKSLDHTATYTLATAKSTAGTRGAKRTQVNLRVSKAFPLAGWGRNEAIGQVFNLFNAKNPTAFVTNRQSSNFMQPTEYAGDFQNTEQRVGQIGFRFSF